MAIGTVSPAHPANSPQPKEHPLSQIIRPEARAFLTRWRDVIVALAIGGLGLYWGLTSGGLVLVFGWALVILALMLGWSALQRMGFATADEDPGIVQVVEGQISYMSPTGGGFASLSELVEIRLARIGASRVWVLVSEGWPDLQIPVGAAGTEALFDAFTTLPGMRSGALIAALHAEADRPQGTTLPIGVTALRQTKIIWSRPRPQVLH